MWAVISNVNTLYRSRLWPVKRRRWRSSGIDEQLVKIGTGASVVAVKAVRISFTKTVSVHLNVLLMVVGGAVVLIVVWTMLLLVLRVM